MHAGFGWENQKMIHQFEYVDYRRIILKWEIVDCVHLAQDTDRRRALVIALVVVQVPHSKRNCLAT